MYAGKYANDLLVHPNIKAVQPLNERLDKMRLRRKNMFDQLH